MITEGYIEDKLTTTDYKDLVDFCCKNNAKGLYMYDAKRKRLWPFFWRFQYTATFRIDFICDLDTNESTFVPHNVLDTI